MKEANGSRIKLSKVQKPQIEEVQLIAFELIIQKEEPFIIQAPKQFTRTHL